jgi:hypothetical protein
MMKALVSIPDFHQCDLSLITCLPTGQDHAHAFNNMLSDVLDVLMTEFKAALVRKGFRRIDIDDMYERGKERLEDERRDPTGK